MPRYKVTSPDGRTLKLTGDSPPTEQELEEIFASLPEKKSLPYQKQEETPYTQSFPEERATEGQKKTATAFNTASLFIPGLLGMQGVLNKISPETGRYATTQRGAFAQKGLSTVSAGLSDALARMALGVKADDSFSDPRFAPMAGSVGETAGALIPSGRIIGGATTLPSLIGRSALSGGLFGFGAGVSREAQKDEPTVSGAILEGTKTAIPTALISAAIPGGMIAGAKLASGAARAFSRRTPKELLTSITGWEGKNKAFIKPQERLESGAYEAILPDIKERLPKGEVTKKVYDDATDKYAEDIIRAVKPTIQNTPAKAFDHASILSDAESNLAFNIPQESRRAAALDSVKPVLEGMDNKNVLDYIRTLNDDIHNLKSSPTPEMFSESIQAKEALADALSSRMKFILQSNGIDPKIWSNYGLARELQNQINTQYRQAGAATAAQRGGGITKELTSGIKQGTYPLARTLNAAENVITRGMQSAQAGIDKQIGLLFKKIKGKPMGIPVPPPAIPEAAIQQSLSAKKAALAEEALKRNVRVFEKLKKIQEERVKQGQ